MQSLSNILSEISTIIKINTELYNYLNQPVVLVSRILNQTTLSLPKYLPLLRVSTMINLLQLNNLPPTLLHIIPDKNEDNLFTEQNITYS